MSVYVAVFPITDIDRHLSELQQEAGLELVDMLIDEDLWPSDAAVWRVVGKHLVGAVSVVPLVPADATPYLAPEALGHGTYAGSKRHQRRGEPLCGPCAEAAYRAKQDMRRRNSRAKAATA